LSSDFTKLGLIVQSLGMGHRYLDIPRAAALLREGGVVAFPTETVYGLGASVFQTQAIQRIFTVKGRPQDNPLIVHIGGFDQLTQIVHPPPPLFEKLAKFFFPGPLTVLLPKLESVPSLVSANLPLIGVRMPAHPLALELIQAVGVPLVAPSANISGRPSSTCALHVHSDFGSKIDGIIDGGRCQYGIESTVISLSATIQILRPGAISKEQLEEVLQESVTYAEACADQPLCPGMKYRHYAPRAKILVFCNFEAFRSYLHQAKPCQRMILERVQPQDLYASLRQADAQKDEEIVIYCNPSIQNNRALMNRLNRASQ
jgi:L-threonylcarbamoyladenylate synthase